MSNRIYIAAIAIALSAGCAKKMEPGQIEPNSLQAPAATPTPAPTPEEADETEGAEAPGASDNAVAACSTPECETACADAGELLSKCIAAFDAGCFSDTLPDDKSICNYAEADGANRSRAKKTVRRQAQPASASESDAPAEQEAAEDVVEGKKGVRTIVIMD